jgi:hypothetical protein
VKLPRLVALAAFALAAVPDAVADCLSDCNDAYEAAMASCQEQFSDPGQEIQLQQCMDSAQAQLGQCNAECEMPD